MNAPHALCLALSTDLPSRLKGTAIIQTVIIYNADTQIHDVVNVVRSHFSGHNGEGSFECLKDALKIYPHGPCQLDDQKQNDFPSWQNSCQERTLEFRYLALALPLLSLLLTIVFNGWAWFLIFLQLGYHVSGPFIADAAVKGVANVSATLGYLPTGLWTQSGLGKP